MTGPTWPGALDIDAAWGQRGEEGGGTGVKRVEQTPSYDAPALAEH